MAITKTKIDVEIDSHIQAQAAEMLSRIGIDQATAIDMFYRQVIALRRLPFTPVVPPSLDEQLAAALDAMNPTEFVIEYDDNGNAIIDKDLYPEIYDWVVNG